MILDGRKVKIEILKTLKEELQAIEQSQRPSLAIISVGDDAASKVYIRQKEKMAEELGYNFYAYNHKESAEEKTIIAQIEALNKDENIDAILVQLPLPPHLDARKIINHISPEKDVDGLTDINIGKLMHKEKALYPCTPTGIIELLNYYNIEISGQNVTIIGRSDLVGKPLAALMTNMDASVTLCHSKTKNLEEQARTADILVSAIGKPKYIGPSYIKEGATVIDVGINRLPDGTLCGDVDYETVKPKTKAITKVPGGVGPMTIAALAKNTYEANRTRRAK